MDLIAKLNKIATVYHNKKQAITTEEATKTALVIPFITALGYDISDPEEVIPEFIADIGIKKGEKVDYAIKINGDLIIIECKKLDSKLDAYNKSQLHRYFHASRAKIAILTNGIVYKFYSDLKQANIMDNDAFFEFSLLQKIDNTLIDKLKKLSKATIDINALLLANKPITQTKQAILFEEESNTITTSQDYLACFALANQGDITAQYQLGLKLQQGEGIERDYSQAIHWYETAAKQNHLAAQVNLAKMRYHLSPLHKNYHQAFYWFSKAAPQNHEAQYYLATMYQHGHGVALNLKLAEYWYIKALENDDSAMKKRVVKACLNKYSALIQ